MICHCRECRDARRKAEQEEYERELAIIEAGDMEDEEEGDDDFGEDEDD